MRSFFISIMVLCCFAVPDISKANLVVIDKVPSYYWYHGCAPTAAAMILGYWDLHGYDNLFDASGWDEVKETSKVQEQISSQAHNDKYNNNSISAKDDPILEKTSLADFMHTSEGSLGDGQTYVSNIGEGIKDYALYRGYDFRVSDESTSWDAYMYEINHGNPVFLNVDTDGNGAVDHSVAGIGFKTKDDDSAWYAAYNTWHENESIITWYPFNSLYDSTMSNLDDSTTFNIGNMLIIRPAYLHPEHEPVPEPTTLVLFSIGLSIISFLRSGKTHEKYKRAGSI